VSGGRRALVATAAAALAVFAALAALAGDRNPGGAVTPSFERQPVARLAHGAVTTLSASRLARSAVVWSGGPTVAATGETVNVYVSAALPPGLGTPQSWADFVAGVLHGPEISSLTVYIAPLTEVQGICGAEALGCYGPDRMVSMGETVDGVTAAEVVRHEYGHHIAFHRLNPPWTAIDWGPKNWASLQNICSRAASGSVYPGDEGYHYRLNPGEGWAETYRLLDERRAGVTGSGWQIVDPSFFPNDAAFVAAERDVVQPWTTGRTSNHATRFTARSKRVWRLPLTTPLDGTADITVSFPRGGLHEVALVDPARKNILATGLWSGRTTKKIVTDVCGQRSLTLRITHTGAFGRVRVVATLP
jgi:hypothetical protein